MATLPLWSLGREFVSNNVFFGIDTLYREYGGLDGGATGMQRCWSL